MVNHKMMEDEKLSAVLVLPVIPTSIRYRAYLECAGHRLILEWLLERVRVLCHSCEFYVLCRSEHDVVAIGEIDASLKILRTTFSSDVGAFCDATGRLGVPKIAFFRLGFGLAPPDLLIRTHELHRQNRANVTTVSGLPMDATPEIYSAELLKSLSELRLRGLASEPRVVVGQLMLAARATSERTPVPLRVATLDAISAYRADPRELPERVTFQTKIDVEIARRARVSLQLRPGHEAPLDPLRAWKRAATAANTSVQRTRPNGHNRHEQQLIREPGKVLIVSNASGFSGGAESVSQLAASLDRKRVVPSAIIGFSGRYTQRLREAGVTVYCPENDLATASTHITNFLARTLRYVKPDILHFQSIEGQPLLVAAAMLDIPLIQHVRIADLRGYRDQLHSAVAVIAVSKFVAQEVLKFDIRPEVVHVIPNGIDLNRFRPGLFDKRAVRNALNIPANAFVALVISRFEPRKRLEVILGAFDALKNRIPDFLLLLVGEISSCAEYFDEMQKRISASRCNRVRFMPFQQDIRLVHAATDVLVLTSEGEAFPRCVLEAMAMGVPVVATNSGGNPELVCDRKSGLLVPVGDEKSLILAIEQIYTNSKFSVALAKNARHFVEDNLSIARTAERTIDVYREVILVRRHSVGRTPKVLTK